MNLLVSKHRNDATIRRIDQSENS